VVERLAAVDAPAASSGGIPAPETGTRRAHGVADGFWSCRAALGRAPERDPRRCAPRSTSGLEARVLELVIAGAPDLDAARTAYETEPATNRRLPEWSALAANTTICGGPRPTFARLEREL